MKAKPFLKDPDAKLDYSIQWTPWLSGDTIASSTWFVPDGLTVASPSPSFESAGLTTIWLSGGAVGAVYDVVNRITTTLGRIDDRTITLEIAQK